MNTLRMPRALAFLLLAHMYWLSGCSAMLLGDGQARGSTAKPVSERQAAASATDRALVRAVHSKLSADQQLSRFGIAVSSSSGTIRLSGTVDSFEAREKAVTIAGDVDGVKNIDNQIRVNTRL